MEFAGIKIGQQKEDNQVTTNHVAHEDIIHGVDGGDEYLERIKKKAKVEEEKVIYGVYDNHDKGLSTKINDFLVDHSSVKLKDKSYFFHMLAVMVDAGIPAVQAVKSLATRTSNEKFRRVLNTVAYNCETGATLSDAMSRFENVFDESEIGIVKSGEATGHLQNMLFKLSDQLDKRHDLYLKLWSAAVYPITVFVVLILVVVGMMVWIFPNLLNLLAPGGVGVENLPLATRILMNVQKAITQYWWMILLAGVGFYGIFNMYINSMNGATKWDYSKLGMPIIGSLIRKLHVLRFVSLLGILIEAGLPVINSLKIIGNSLKNRIYKLEVQDLIEKVKAGKKISESLMDNGYLFPPEIVQMIAVGEGSANLGRVSEKIADQYQKEIDNSLKKLTSIFEPVMILFVGLMVGLLALAIMAPIFNLSNSGAIS
ncbi:MAG: type II secretion system F family protein [Patescibacteria group bacterium]